MKITLREDWRGIVDGTPIPTEYLNPILKGLYNISQTPSWLKGVEVVSGRKRFLFNGEQGYHNGTSVPIKALTSELSDLTRLNVFWDYERKELSLWK